MRISPIFMYRRRLKAVRQILKPLWDSIDEICKDFKSGHRPIGDRFDVVNTKNKVK